MEAKLSRYRERGILSIEENGIRVAYLKLTFPDVSTMVIESTQVSKSHEGTGLGKQLLKAAVDLARKDNLKILAVCPYAKSVFAKTDEYNDILN